MDAPLNLRLVFAGTPVFAAEHLQALISSQHSVVGVYTQPDRPAGRGKELMTSAVKQLAVESKIPVFQPHSLKPLEEQQTLGSLKADLMIVVAYGLLLPPHILQTPTFGCLNVHASLLPRWRGAAPIQRAIEAGDEESGITIMQMDEGLDTGDMLLKVTCPIRKNDTAGMLHDRLAELGPPVLLKVIEQIANGTVIREKQNHENNSYAKKISKQDALLNWQEDAHIVDQKIRAFNPTPVCFAILKSEKLKEEVRVRIFQAEALNSDKKNKMPGEILDVSTEGIQVACSRGILNVLSLQLPGKKVMTIKEFVNGHQHLIPKGSRLF